VIWRYNSDGRRPTTFTVVAEVYRVRRDRHGDRLISNAQHASVKRALVNLRRKGLVSGSQEIVTARDGTRIFSMAKSPGDGRAERCCLWSIERTPSYEFISRITAERAGIATVPCWIREMSDADAYMALALNNAQGELSPLEIGLHALGSGLSQRAYAEQVGMAQTTLVHRWQAAEVLNYLG
jgi:hypothetical protein